jgi:hypothetical protein
MRLTPMTLILTFTFSLLPLVVSAEQGQPTKAMDIDLFNAQFNGKYIDEITLDDITNWLGRPSAILEYEQDVFVVDIYYHERGLGFNVKSQKNDSQQHCRSIYVYLAKALDSRFSKYFLSYRGTISNNLNGNWKAPQVKLEFNSFQIKDYFEDKFMKSIASSGRSLKEISEVYRHILTTSKSIHTRLAQ